MSKKRCKTKKKKIKQKIRTKTEKIIFCQKKECFKKADEKVQIYFNHNFKLIDELFLCDYHGKEIDEEIDKIEKEFIEEE